MDFERELNEPPSSNFRVLRSLPATGTPHGWAFYGASDEKMAQWLEDAERQRELRRNPI
jgi:hypothetical protein